MINPVNKISEKAGFAPGSLIPVGIEEVTPTRFVITTVTATDINEKTVLALNEEELRPQADTLIWIDVQGLSSMNSLKRLFAALELHPLFQEDLVNMQHRSKLEMLDDNMLIITKRLILNNKERIITEQMSIVANKNFIITLQAPTIDSYSGVRTRLKNLQLRELGRTYLLYMLLDNLVDSHYAIIEHLYAATDKTEKRLLQPDVTTPLTEILRLKHNIEITRRTIMPLQKIVNKICLIRHQLFAPNVHPYLDDLNDHAEQLAESCDACHEAITFIIQLNRDNINLRTNEVMKTLSLISTVFLPLTFIAGVYGMNFEFMPELKATWGYPACLAIMTAVAFFMHRAFKKKNWL